jgi:plasmid stability protein
MTALNSEGEITLPVLTVRGVSDEVHQALRLRVALNGRSMEAEVRDILRITLKQGVRVQMADATRKQDIAGIK